MRNTKQPRLLTAKRDARTAMRDTQLRNARLLQNYLLAKRYHRQQADA